MSDEIITGHWTKAKLAALSVSQRHTLWKNCRTKVSADAVALVKAIEELGLPYSDDACLTSDDPITIKMTEIIYSTAGKAACLQATADGLPAIAGVDGMLSEALGVDYRGGNMGTQTAGSIVGAVMRSLGFKKSGERPMPAGSVAKTGAFWVPQTQLPLKKS